jgi:hypothetical protein
MNRQQIHQDLTTHFTADELVLLAGRVGVNFNTLGGKSLPDKTGSLISKVERNGRLPELVYWMVQAKPALGVVYKSQLQRESGAKDSRLEWLDGLAAGEGPAIEEPPTMRWDSEEHPRMEE